MTEAAWDGTAAEVVPGILRGWTNVTPTSLDAGETYDWLAPTVLGYLRSQRAADPEDLLGEVFFQVARDIHRFRGDRAALRRWIFTIAHHRLADDRRHRSRRPLDYVPDVPEQAVYGRGVESFDPELFAALGQLSSDQREVVVLRFLADLPLRDVARITRRRVGAVKSLQARALFALHEKLAAE